MIYYRYYLEQFKICLGEDKEKAIKRYFSLKKEILNDLKETARDIQNLDRYTKEFKNIYHYINILIFEFMVDEEDIFKTIDLIIKKFNLNQKKEKIFFNSVRNWIAEIEALTYGSLRKKYPVKSPKEIIRKIDTYQY